MNNEPVENLNKLSMYKFENFFKVYEDIGRGLYYYNILKNVSIFPANDPSVETEYFTKYEDTWPLISYKNYNTMDLWWLVCEYNQITNPVKHPEVGTKLKILNSSFVGPIILELNKQFNR